VGQLGHSGEIEDLPNIREAVAAIQTPVPTQIVVWCIPSGQRDFIAHTNVSDAMRPGVVGGEVQLAPEPIRGVEQKTVVV